ncbi:MAG: ABC transporter permease [Deltaproteobacteria bacterium]|nr:ABC transporter permease [Deltaproteobacteria bacterium]
MKTFLVLARIGFRNIRRNVRRSLLTILAISFGLFCLIVFQALKAGLHKEMVSSTLGLDAGTIQVHAAGYEANTAVIQPMANIAEAKRTLATLGLTRFSERIKSPALLLAGRKSSAILLAGVLPGDEQQVTFIGRKMVEGSYLAEADRLLLGSPLAVSLGVRSGDEVVLMAQGMLGRPATRKFVIGGIYQTDLATFDRSHVYLPLPAAQHFLGADEVVTEIALLTEAERAQSLATALREKLDPGLFQVSSWQKVAPDLDQLIKLNDATMGLLVFIVFAIVAMGITNTMTTVIFERFREFGILNAIGTGPTAIVSLVVLESLFLGLIATILGLLAGIAACSWLQRYGLDLSSFISANQYFASGHVLKAHVLAEDLVSSALVTLATAIVAGIYPAWKASRMDPVKALLHN